eukprot:1196057-Prorocentrum_minimum.AAC.4
MSHSRQSSVTHSVKRYTLEHGEVQVAKQTGHIAIGTVRTSWSVGWRRTRAHMDGLVCHLCYMSERQLSVPRMCVDQCGCDVCYNKRGCIMRTNKRKPCTSAGGAGGAGRSAPVGRTARRGRI